MRSFRLFSLASVAAVTAASAGAAAASGPGPLTHARLTRASLAPEPVPEPAPDYNLAAAGARRALEVRRQVDFELWVFTSLVAEAQRQAAFAAWVTTASQSGGSPAPSHSHAPSYSVSGGGGGGGGDRFARIRQCESGGNYSTNTGNGYYGAYQFSLSTWHSLGYSGLPSDAPPAVQDQAAQQLAARSGFGQWPVCGR